MTDFYNDMADASLDLLQELGQDVTISRVGADAIFDPATGEFTSSGTDQSQVVQGAKVPVGKGSLNQSDEQFMQDFVRGKVHMLIIAAKGVSFKPRSGDKATISGEQYEIIGNTPISPAGTDVIYKVPIRQT